MKVTRFTILRCVFLILLMSPVARQCQAHDWPKHGFAAERFHTQCWGQRMQLAPMSAEDSASQADEAPVTSGLAVKAADRRLSPGQAKMARNAAAASPRLATHSGVRLTWLSDLAQLAAEYKTLHPHVARQANTLARWEFLPTFDSRSPRALHVRPALAQLPPIPQPVAAHRFTEEYRPYDMDDQARVARSMQPGQLNPRTSMADAMRGSLTTLRNAADTAYTQLQWLSFAQHLGQRITKLSMGVESRLASVLATLPRSQTLHSPSAHVLPSYVWVQTQAGDSLLVSADLARTWSENRQAAAQAASAKEIQGIGFAASVQSRIASSLSKRLAAAASALTAASESLERFSTQRVAQASQDALR